MAALRLKIIACKVFYRELSVLCAASEHNTDVTYMRQSLHCVPAKLGAALREEITSIDSGKDIHTTYPPYEGEFDAILLGFGLCSNIVDGLGSSKTALIIPRVHDCISLFLGSREKYDELYKTYKGAYWYNRAWVETAYVPGPLSHEACLEMYRRRYGNEKAEKLVFASEEWRTNYNSAAFIRSDLFDSRESEEYSKICAEYIGWEHRVVDGDSAYLRDFINGNWDEKRFLTVPPGKRAALTYDERIFEAR